VDAPLTQREHSGLRAHGLALCSWSASHFFGNFAQIDTSHQVHFSRVDL
jgi:hypothetical protein